MSQLDHTTSGNLEAPERISPARTNVIPPAQSGRFARIDVLRALAALSVVIYHTIGAKIGWHFPWRDNGLPDLSSSGWNAAPLAFLSLGWAGVPLFFALSGFCIHSAFLRQSHFDARVFFWRRFWRIYPPFLAAIAVFSFWPIHHLGTDATLADLLHHLCTTFTLVPDKFWSPLNPSLWSVAAEFQCYLLYPVFLWLRSRHGIAAATLGWFAFSAFGKLLFSALAGWPDHAINFWSCVSIFSFGDWALGALVAEDLFTKQKRAFYSNGAFVAVLAACALSVLWRPTLTLSFTFAAIAGMLLIKLYADRAAPVNRIERMLARVGLVSYSLYLWHQPLLGPLERLGRELCAGLPLNLARLGTYLVIAACLAIITASSYYLLERPGIYLASRLRAKPPRP